MSSNTKESRLIYFDTVKPMPVQWLWQDYIPYKKVSCIVGDSGTGKTTLALTLAALLSTGRAMPLSYAEPITGSTIFQSAEDGASDTLKPRLISAGADCSKVAFIEASALNIDSDCEIIENHIREAKARLTVFDPLQGYIGKHADMGRAADIRRLMTNLATIAERNNCAIVIIGHFNKGQGSKDLYRVLGSVDITAAARSVLFVRASENDPETRIISQVKSSLGPKAASIAFRIEEGARINFLGEYEEDTLLDDEEYDDTDDKLDKATEVMLEMLTGQLCLGTDVYKACKALGISPRTVERAKKELKVRSIKKERRGYWTI